MYAYRAQMPGHWAPLLLRWLVSWWVDQGHEVWVVDLDESHAYNGIQRSGLESVPGPWFPGLGSWAGNFYGSLTARISTPRGLTGPYQLLHGCAQGDYGGVGTYTALRAMRTAFHRGVLRHGLQVSDLQGGGGVDAAGRWAAPAWWRRADH